VLWRHGRTAWNDDRRFQGQTDIPLDDHGRQQARRAARLLAALPPTALVSSDLVRARDTVAELAGLTGLPVAVDPRLRETHAGRWEGLLAHEIEATDPVVWRAWQAGAAGVRPGGGETRSQVADRAVSAVSAALPQVPGDGVLVVGTHGGTARALIGRLLGLPEQDWHVLGGLANCSWSVLVESSHGWRLEEHNAGMLPEPVVGTDDP
jgi:glucosyl-3-phosphoglycerate phosphatase